MLEAIVKFSSLGNINSEHDITHSENGELECVEFVLLKTYTSEASTSVECKVNSKHVCIILGLPVEITVQELEIFLEPYHSEILRFHLVIEVRNPLSNTELHLKRDHQHRKYGFILFCSHAAMLNFQEVYSNLVFPSYSEVAPCIVIIPDQLQIIPVSNDTSNSFLPSLNSSDLAVKSSQQSNLSSITVPHLKTPAEEMDQIHLTREFQIFNLYASVVSFSNIQKNSSNDHIWDESSPSPHSMNDSSTSQAVLWSQYASSHFESKNNSQTNEVTSKGFYLPTCVVCLRRLRYIRNLLSIDRVYTSSTLHEDGTIESAAFKPPPYSSYPRENLSVVRSFTQIFTDRVNSSPFDSSSHSPPSSSSGATALVGKRSQRSCITDLNLTSDGKIRCITCNVYNITRHYHEFALENQKLDLIEEKFNVSLSRDFSSISIEGASSSLSQHQLHSVAHQNKGERLKLLEKWSNCLECSLGDNIWMCLICSYTGCGRYSAKHAQKHYLVSNPKHSLSMELLSGRIWDYELDKFVHVEDEQTSLDLNHIEYDHDKRSIEKNPFIDQQFMMSHRPWMARHPVAGLEPSHDMITMEKMNNIIRSYENLIQLQLQDQQLYYEKLLAKETVKMLETCYGPSNHVISSDKSRDTTNESHKILQPSTGGGSMKLISDHLTEDSVDDEEEDRKLMMEIEDSKLEISRIELEYRQIMEQIKVVETESRKVQKSNDKHIKSLKNKKLKEAELLNEEILLKQRCTDQVTDMEQQLKDLSFYLKTRNRMEDSPMKEEINQGSLMVVSSKSLFTTEKDVKKKNSSSVKKH